jgi:hypothetical protein
MSNAVVPGEGRGREIRLTRLLHRSHYFTPAPPRGRRRNHPPVATHLPGGLAAIFLRRSGGRCDARSARLCGDR